MKKVLFQTLAILCCLSFILGSTGCSLKKNISEAFAEKLADYANEKGDYTNTFSIKVSEDFMKDTWILYSNAKYDSESGEQPTIQYKLMDERGNVLYSAFPYVIGAEDEYMQKEWRVPPTREHYNTVQIQVVIPQGVTLSIQEFCHKTNEESVTKGDDDKIKYISHTGLYGYAPTNTKLAFEMAGEMGYKSLITIVKFTKDNVAVCLHDDDTVRRLLRYEDGTYITDGSKDDKPVEKFTYEELQALSAGWEKDAVYQDCKVPTLEEYFEVCKKYDMDPIFSVHPDLTVKQWNYIKGRLEHHGLLEKFYVKTGNLSELKKTREIFGDTIGGYIIIMPYNGSYSLYSVAQRAGFVKTDAPNVVDMERYNLSVAFFQHSENLDREISDAKAEGFQNIEVYGFNGIRGQEFTRLKELGVNIFALDYHASVGLNY